MSADPSKKADLLEVPTVRLARQHTTLNVSGADPEFIRDERGEIRARLARPGRNEMPNKSKITARTHAGWTTQERGPRPGVQKKRL